MARASARHILVSSEEQCNALKQEIEKRPRFRGRSQAALQLPLRPSGRRPGQLWPRPNGAGIRQSRLQR